MSPSRPRLPTRRLAPVRWRPRSPRWSRPVAACGWSGSPGPRVTLVAGDRVEIRERDERCRGAAGPPSRPEDDHAPDPGTAEAERARGGTEPLVTTADAVQVRVLGEHRTAGASARLDVVDPRTSSADRATPPTAGAAGRVGQADDLQPGASGAPTRACGAAPPASARSAPRSCTTPPAPTPTPPTRCPPSCAVSTTSTSTAGAGTTSATTSSSTSSAGSGRAAPEASTYRSWAPRQVATTARPSGPRRSVTSPASHRPRRS